MITGGAAATGVALACGLAGVAGCGQADEGTTTAHDSKPMTGAAASGHGKTVYARAARLSRGAHDIELLSMPGVGRLLVSCDERGTTSTAFVAGRHTATADVVVESRGSTADRELDPAQRFAPRLARADSGVQEWSVAQFSQANAAITTMTVAIRPVTRSGHACAVSSTALVVRTAGTLTR